MISKVVKTFKNMIVDIIFYKDSFELRNIYKENIYVIVGESTPAERKVLKTGESAMFNCKNFTKINIEIRTLDEVPLDRLKIKLKDRKPLSSLFTKENK